MIGLLGRAFAVNKEPENQGPYYEKKPGSIILKPFTYP